MAQAKYFELSDARREAQVVGLGTGEGREAGIGFQLVALDAYVKAAAAFNAATPDAAARVKLLFEIHR